MVLVLRLFVGLGTFSLRAMVFLPEDWLVLGAGYLLGAFLGKLALHGVVLWLGAVAAGSLFCQRAGILFSRPFSRSRVRFWPEPGALHLCLFQSFL